MKIVCAYNKEDKEITKLIGRKFRSYKLVFPLLNEGDTVTLETNLGYKSLGMTDGEYWMQRRFSPEY
jgi:hypothetical protein